MYPYMYYSYDTGYLLMVVTCLVLGMIAQAYINAQYNKWSRIPADGASGSQVARLMLDSSNCSEVAIYSTPGHLTDHYDPRSNALYLSGDNMSGGSVASVAVACHEAGHAVQRKQGYFMMKVRHALVPVVNFMSNAWIFIFLFGMFTSVTRMYSIAVFMFAFTVLFHLVTLPVEINASRRALAYIEASGMSPACVRGARQVLVAAALTYVAAALSSALQFLYLLRQANSDN